MSEAKKRTARLPVCWPRPELERMEEDVVAKDPPIDDTVNRRSAAADGFPPAAEAAMRRRDVTVFIVFVSHCVCLMFISVHTSPLQFCRTGCSSHRDVIKFTARDDRQPIAEALGSGKGRPETSKRGGIALDYNNNNTACLVFRLASGQSKQQPRQTRCCR